jgi:hypothetical protein
MQLGTGDRYKVADHFVGRLGVLYQFATCYAGHQGPVRF